jgi:hypothetical protein
MSELIPNNSDFILYTSQNGEVRVDVFVHKESVWLTQKAMQDLFDRSKSTATYRQKTGGFNDKKELELFLFEEPKLDYGNELIF